MLQKLIFILNLTAAVATAGSVGDFAPLEVGNVWVYNSIYLDETGYRSMYVDDSSFLTIELLNIEEIKDTISYIFKNLVSGKKISRFIYPGIDNRNIFDTTYYSDSIYFDTLYEFEDSIFAPYTYSTKGEDYPPTLPVCEKHEIDTTSLNAIDTLRLIDGVFEYKPFIYSWGDNRRTYRAGIGIYWDCRRWENHGWCIRTTTLLSFSRNGKINSVIQPNKQKINSVLFTTGPAKSSLSIPYLNIVKGNRMFNLLGRVNKGNRRIKEASHKVRIVTK